MTLPARYVPHTVGFFTIIPTLLIAYFFGDINTDLSQYVAKLFTRPINDSFLTIGYLLLLVPSIAKKDWDEVKLTVYVGLVETAIVHLLKFATSESLLRPSGSTEGFPSGHAAAAFALAFLLSRRYINLSPVVFPIAMLISWSRVELNDHYVYQLAVGAPLGLGVGVYFSRLFDRKRVVKNGNTRGGQHKAVY